MLQSRGAEERLIVGDVRAIRALTFDVGGTMLDWHTGIRGAMTAFGNARGLERDWALFTNSWRRRALDSMTTGFTGRVTDLNIDDIHRETLDVVLAEFSIDEPAEDEKRALVAAWHRIPPWPDVPEAHARLAKRFVVSTLTILSVSMIVDVSRLAPFHWDCVISCEMLGHYKPDPYVYASAVKLLQLQPHNICMVATHNFDLLAAKAAGYQTAFVKRPDEYGIGLTPPSTPHESIDFVADDFGGLAAQLGA